jgi:hypothetical protein
MIVSMLKTFYWQIIVFDNSATWKTISDIPFWCDNHLERYSDIPLPEQD